MEKIIIKNQEIEILAVESFYDGIGVKTKAIDITKALELFPTGELVSFELVNASNVVYGVYSNLRAYSIAKISIENQDGVLEEHIEIKLGITNETTQRIKNLEQQLLDTQYALTEIYEGMVL